jgi:cytochrome c biogenesis protein CcmG/thiol:disulfide interchange protein DsbE
MGDTPAPLAEPPPAAPRRGLASVDRPTLVVVALLVTIGLSWLVWARLTATPGGGIGWSALDAVRAANADRFVARAAPAFTLRDAEGELVSLEDLRGRVVLINFWATWCVPCRAEMPELDRAAREYHEDGFRVLAVNILEDAESIRRFGEELNLGIPLLVDRAGDVYKAYSVQGLPASFLVDRDGVIRDVHLGVITRAYLDNKVRRLLQSPPA